MNQVIEVPDARQQSLKTIGHISYGLHALVAVTAVIPGVQASILLLLIAFGLDMVKRADAAGTWQESHFRWRIRSVVWAGVLYIVTAPLFLLLWIPGMLAWFVVSLWFLYRVVRGWMRLGAGEPMPVPTP